MRTKIKLLADWSDFKTGQILALDEAEAKELIEKGAAVAYNPDAEAKAAKEKADADAAEAAKFNAAVEAEVAKRAVQPKTIPSGPIQVHERVEDDPKHGFKSFGEFCKSVYDSAKGAIAPDKRLLIEPKAASGMNRTVDSEGGFLVPEEMAAELLKNTYETAMVASRARKIPMTTQKLSFPALVETSRVDGSRQGGVRAYWKAEAAQYTSSKPGLGEVELNLSKLTGLAYFTDEIGRFSSIGIEQFLTALFAEEFAFKLDDGMINGTGAGQPLGILNAPALVSQAKETAQTAATIVSENILKMWSRMPSRNRSTACWFVNQDVEPQLFAMSLAAGTAGVVTYLPAGGLSAKPYSTLMGLPVIPIEQCATLGTVGDVILADMNSYLYGYASDGIIGATSIHLKFDYDEMAMRWTLYADGQPWQKSAVTPYKGTSTQSPFVVLATRA